MCHCAAAGRFMTHFSMACGTHALPKRVIEYQRFSGFFTSGNSHHASASVLGGYAALRDCYPLETKINL
jgi:hypothetical protein